MSQTTYTAYVLQRADNAKFLGKHMDIWVDMIQHATFYVHLDNADREAVYYNVRDVECSVKEITLTLDES